MKLTAGKRIRLLTENSLVKIVTGKVEVYIVTREKKDFRRTFLMELSSGAVAFPSCDNFGEVDIELYALEDSELQDTPADGLDGRELAYLMRLWFKNLTTVPFVKRLADKGDETIKSWSGESLFNENIKDAKTLWADFVYNESIFSAMVGLSFRSDDVEFARRVQSRIKQKNRLVDNTLSVLVGEETIPMEEGAVANEKLRKVSFAVRTALRALKMPDIVARLQPELVNKLDGFGLMQRLAQKGGMWYRLITLDKDWYLGDSGVILAYYQDGEEKELAACVPQSEKSYRLITYKRPEGIPITEEVAAKIETEAFACYAGLSPGKLTLRRY